MGTKYCPVCKEVVDAKVLGRYSQVEFMGIPVKRRKIIHLEEDGGCGHEWYTVEIAEEVLEL
ncbi:hypothetical protein [uncultured Desulfosarcina sp.]|uniref:hypothetical protein n=1 Tax=uncultured Desulfosarcina sp. TaxID=218289 RepID=UPI0029C90E70|nr:hypothetical protein [uncultured Desulfosarcina sp.]